LLAVADAEPPPVASAVALLEVGPVALAEAEPPVFATEVH
jgi:hypothetical protein